MNYECKKCGDQGYSVYCLQCGSDDMKQVPDAVVTPVLHEGDIKGTPARDISAEVLRAGLGCEWTQDREFYGDATGQWNTGCDNCFTLFDGTPDDNGMKFCCYCGKELKTVLTPIPEVEDEETM